MGDMIVGTSTEMCPEEEIRMREKECLLHILEMVPGTEFNNKPKADRTRIVKAYCRSAAGQDMQTRKCLRTPDTLLKTINYLLVDVITTKILPWNNVYDFIMDRFLAIRQDMVIQRLSAAHCISILQPIIRFHAYSAYKLCEVPMSKFDPVLNTQNLQECLKRLLVLYDECDQFQIKSFNLPSSDPVQYDKLFADSRPCMEALYVIFNLGNVSAIDRVLKLPKLYKTDIVQKVLKISLCYINGNWIRACRLLYELPSILAGAGALHLPKIRKLALHMMSVAYNSKNLCFPAEDVKALLLYSSLEDLKLDCRHYGISYNETSSTIHFQKSSFNTSASVCPSRHESFVTRKMNGTSVTALTLYGEIF